MCFSFDQVKNSFAHFGGLKKWEKHFIPKFSFFLLFFEVKESFQQKIYILRYLWFKKYVNFVACAPRGRTAKFEDFFKLNS